MMQYVMCCGWRRCLRFATHEYAVVSSPTYHVYEARAYVCRSHFEEALRMFIRTGEVHVDHL